MGAPHHQKEPTLSCNARRMEIKYLRNEGLRGAKPVMQTITVLHDISLDPAAFIAMSAHRKEPAQAGYEDHRFSYIVGWCAHVDPSVQTSTCPTTGEPPLSTSGPTILISSPRCASLKIYPRSPEDLAPALFSRFLG